ncbi:MAG: hypothetical protein L6435_17260, partial [Anaerolineae bacterium]|nr:hypothetical protein [Anaerolineae bacterium]
MTSDPLAFYATRRVGQELRLREWWRIREREEASEEHVEAKDTIARLVPAPDEGWRKCEYRYKNVWEKRDGLDRWQREALDR